MQTNYLISLCENVLLSCANLLYLSFHRLSESLSNHTNSYLVVNNQYNEGHSSGESGTLYLNFKK